MSSAPAPNTAPTTESTLRFLRTVQGILLFSMLMYAVVGEKIAPHMDRPLQPAVLVGMAVVCAAMLGIAVWAQIARIRPAIQALQLKHEDEVSLQRWREGTILSCVLLEAVVLEGFALRFIGGTFLDSLPFYFVGIVLMIFYWPQRP